jgi:hypothetical protein
MYPDAARRLGRDCNRRHFLSRREDDGWLREASISRWIREVGWNHVTGEERNETWRGDENRVYTGLDHGDSRAFQGLEILHAMPFSPVGDA